MKYSVMTNTQQTTKLPASWWALARGETLRLTGAPGSRCLQVLEGRVWITADGTKHAPSTDIWLQAGDELVMPAFSRWVIEADSAARFQLLVPPRAVEAVPLLAALRARVGRLGRPAGARCPGWS